MRIGIIGGTGKEGRGLALRWARAGHDVAIGSRDAAKARERAREIAAILDRTVEGGDNAFAAAWGSLAVLTVPYAAHEDTVRGLVAPLAGRILINLVVPLVPPKVSQVYLPAGQSAALEAQALLPATKVVAALHHVSAAHLADFEYKVDCDVLVCGDDEAARAQVIALVADLGLRGLDAGVLRNAIALESLVPVLIHLNKRYKSAGTAIRITGLP